MIYYIIFAIYVASALLCHASLSIMHWALPGNEEGSLLDQAYAHGRKHSKQVVPVISLIPVFNTLAAVLNSIGLILLGIKALGRWISDYYQAWLYIKRDRKIRELHAEILRKVKKATQLSIDLDLWGQKHSNRSRKIVSDYFDKKPPSELPPTL